MSKSTIRYWYRPDTGRSYIRFANGTQVSCAGRITKCRMVAMHYAFLRKLPAKFRLLLKSEKKECMTGKQIPLP